MSYPVSRNATAVCRPRSRKLSTVIDDGMRHHGMEPLEPLDDEEDDDGV